MFGSTIYYSNPERLRKLIYNKASKEILIRYKRNILYYILKLDKQICQAIIL